MNPTSLPVPTAGIVPPMITPLAARDRLDHEGVDALVEHILTSDVAGLFLLGTCGEGPALPFKLQTELVERVCSQVNDRVPVLVGISNPSIDDALGLADHAADCGVAGVVSTMPYYFPLPDEQRLAHLVQLAERSPLPLIVYNMPSCVHGTITVEMLRRLSDEPNVAGFKDKRRRYESL
ncbi:MAG: dihydrodipicolinate synthase family protein [Pirellulaceae bacterium]